MNLRIGLGEDLHRLETGLPFVLGGVPIDFHKGCKAHSDGDVLAHAIADALLGALACGDIGDWFPPSDARYKNADSMRLLKECYKKAESLGYSIVNIDTVVRLEEPKLFSYKEAIRRNIAEALGLQMEQTAFKAKTSEGLGSIGKGEAVAAFAVVLLHKKG